MTSLHRTWLVPLLVGLGGVVVATWLAPRAAVTGERLGDHLRASRKAVGLSLRGVEARTHITNGYLSQIESNAVDQPSPNMLYKLSEVYGLDYLDLLARAGHHVPAASGQERSTVLAGIPLRALEELTDDEAVQLRDYLAFLQAKRDR